MLVQPAGLPLADPLQGSIPARQDVSLTDEYDSRMSLKHIQTLTFLGPAVGLSVRNRRRQGKRRIFLIHHSFACLQGRQIPSQCDCVQSLLSCDGSKRAVLYAGKWFLFISVILSKQCIIKEVIITMLNTVG